MMAKDLSVKDKIRQFLLENPVYSGTVPSDLTDSFPLVDAGVLDSIGIYTLVAHLEKIFSMQIEVSDLTEKNFNSLLAIENFVRARTSLS
jgi:acyl carrier protein